MVSERTMDVAPPLINPILKAFRTGAAAIDNDDHGAPRRIGKYVLFSLLSYFTISNARRNEV